MAKKIIAPSLRRTAQNWGGYWTYVTAVLIILFVAFLATKGRLATWIALFSWSSPQNVVYQDASANAPAANSGSPATVGALNPSTMFQGLLSGNVGQTLGMAPIQPGPPSNPASPLATGWKDLLGRLKFGLGG